MNRTQILKELGVTPWVLKTPESNSSQVPDSILSPVSKAVSPTSSEQNIMPAKELKPTWVIVAKPNVIQTPIFVKIIGAIRKFGVDTLILEFNPTRWQVELVKGDLVISFGDATAQFFSNEPSTAQDLREIIFETQNHEGNDIPVIITHDIEVLRKNPIKKKEVWNDLVMARSVYLEMH
jgi:hypothetical protein